MFDFASLPGIMVWLGALVAVAAVVIGAWQKGKHAPIFALVAVIGVGSMFVGGLLTANVANTSNNGGGSTPTTADQISVVVATTPAVPTGCTLYANAYNMNCLMEYNKTSNAYCFVASFAATNACKTGANYLLIGFKMIRVDNDNKTVSFPNTLASIYTANSLGATGTTYGLLVGYTAQTSTAPGQWQVFPSAGTLASQKPTVVAPTVATGVLTDGLPIQSFATATNIWHMSLPGSNSTAAPLAFAQAITNNTAFPGVVFNFGNTIAGQGQFTVFVNVVGWTT